MQVLILQHLPSSKGGDISSNCSPNFHRKVAGCCSKLLQSCQCPELGEWCLGEGLGEEVSNVGRSGNILGLNCPILHLIPHPVVVPLVPCSNMLSPGRNWYLTCNECWQSYVSARPCACRSTYLLNATLTKSTHDLNQCCTAV
jgi:hypothetical protein